MFLTGNEKQTLTRIFLLLELILEPLVADVTDVALDLPLAAGVLFGHDVIPGTAVEVVHDVVELQLLQAQLRWPTRLTDILGRTKYDRTLKLTVMGNTSNQCSEAKIQFITSVKDLGTTSLWGEGAAHDPR